MAWDGSVAELVVIAQALGAQCLSHIVGDVWMHEALPAACQPRRIIEEDVARRYHQPLAVWQPHLGHTSGDHSFKQERK